MEQWHKISNYFRQFPSELRNGNFFITAKIGFFLKEVSMGAFAHFINVYLNDVGLNTEEVGFIAGLTFAGMSICSPLFGLLIDYTGRRQLLYTIFALSVSCGVLTMPFVARITNHFSSVVATTAAATTMSTVSTWASTSIPVAIPVTNSSNSTTVSSVSPTISPHVYHSFASHTFFAMLALDVAGKSCGAILPSMMDAAVVNILHRKPTCNYGGSRVWGSIGFGVGALFAGIVTDLLADFFEGHGLSRYTAAFGLAAICQVVSLPPVLYVIGKMRFEDEPKKEEVEDKNPVVLEKGETACDEVENNNPSKLSLMIETFQKLENIMFLMTVIVGGVSLMALTGFLSIFMDKMHASDKMKGAAIAVQSWIQLLVFPFDRTIIKKVGGSMAAMEIGLLSFCIRFIVDSYLRSPEFLLCTQVLHAFGFALFWAATVEHTKMIAPDAIYVTIFTLVSGLYYGLGGLVGNIVGGIIYHQFSGEALFLSMGIMNGVWVVITAMYFHGGKWIGKKRQSKVKVEPLDETDETL